MTTSPPIGVSLTSLASSRQANDENKSKLDINDELTNVQEEALEIENEITDVRKKISQVKKRIADLKYVIGLIPRRSTTVPKNIVDTLTDRNVLLLCKLNKASLMKRLPNLQEQLTYLNRRLTAEQLEKLSTGLTTTSTAVFSNTVAVLDMKDLLPVKDVVEQPVDAGSTLFLTQVWIDDRVAEIHTEFVRKDGRVGSYRKPPMAVMRCSRGGRTRALIELALRIKSQYPDVTAFRISFSHVTPLEDFEQDDLVGAVCRRIAFEARKDKKTTFDDFLKFSVTEKQIKAWLGDAPLVLFLDRINYAEALSVTDSKVGTEFASFLKKHFLSPRNRYLVFSSNTVHDAKTLPACMESNSYRQVNVRQLPLIPRFDLFFLEFIPAIIYVALVSRRRETLLISHR